MWRSSGALNALLLAAVVICALSVVTSQHKARKLYIELQEQKELARQMDVEWGQLQLEQSAWAAPARVEKIAARQLQMQMPRSGQIRFIRVEPPSPQSSPVKKPSPQSSDGTTSNSTWLAKNASQVAGYPASGRGSERERQSLTLGRGGNRPLSPWEKGSENFNGYINKQP